MSTELDPAASVASAPSVTPLTVRRGSRGSRVASGVLFVAVLLLFALPYLVESGTVFRLINLCVYVVLASMWNLLAGYGGMVSIGQQAYIGLGAYGLVLLSDHAGLDAFLSVPVAAVAAGVVAVPISFLAFRLTGGYFAIGTWVIAEVIRLITVQDDTLGAGSGVSLRSLAGTDRTLRVAVTYWWALGTAVAAVLLVYLLLRSRAGIALTAVRDERTAAASLGVAVTRVRRLVFVVAAAGCGAAGALTALSTLRVQPDSAFGVQWTAFMIFMVVIGGVGTIEGPIVGAVVFFVLQEWLADLGALYLVILGILAVVIVLVAPRGLWGLVAGRSGRQVFAVGYRVRPRGRGGSDER